MRKHFSPARLTAMLLVFCVTAALLCVPAFADTTDPVTASSTADGETAAVTYEGNVNVTADNTAAVLAGASGASSEASAEITGNVSVTGEDSSAVAALSSGGDSTAAVSVEGDLSASGTGSIAVKAVSTANPGSTAEVDVTGNISTDNTFASAVVASSAQTGSITEVNITGNVSQSGAAVAVIYVTSAGDSEAIVNVDGNVSGPSAGLELNSVGAGMASATVTGDVNADAMGIRAEGTSGLDYAAVGGDVTGGDMGIQIWNGSAKDIFVGGTASGSMYGLVADPSNVNEEICDVTVWKIDGDILATESFCQNAIHYIVKHAEGESGTGFTSTGEGGSALTQYHGYDTAQEGQVIILTPDAGKQILEAYNGSVKLTADANGVFSFVVPRGGGILLSVKFGEAGGEETQVIIFVLSFDLGGGKMPEGEELPAAVVAGQKITLPAAPEREGYKFVGWEVTVRGEKVILQPGEKFTVTADKTFTAIWEKE